MNKVKFIKSKDTNYIFHMLSVARCGYDNAYGDGYRGIYPAQDLKIIKENESLLTVCGGEHCGLLYGILVSEPACANISAKCYYARLAESIDKGEPPDGPLRKYAGIIHAVSSVMVKYYDHYMTNIWIKEEEKIDEYIPQILRFFEDTGFSDRAEMMVGHKLPHDCFKATLVTSVENGAEAIDISEELDVFGIERDPLDAFYFIGHEFIICLLFDALKEENAFHTFETWPLTEGLAEYYLKKVMGDTRFINEQLKWVTFYEKCESTWKQQSPVDLYRHGLQAINVL